MAQVDVLIADLEQVHSRVVGQQSPLH